MIKYSHNYCPKLVNCILKSISNNECYFGYVNIFKKTNGYCMNRVMSDVNR